jgi:hypothetical protein
MSATGTYVRAGLPEVAIALAVLTDEPHPSHPKDRVLTGRDSQVLPDKLLSVPVEYPEPARATGKELSGL